MREHLGFLKISSVVVKIAAWIFLVLGLIGGGAVFLGALPDTDMPRWMGLFIIALYVFIFFFLFLIATISDLLVKVIDEIKKEESLLEQNLHTK